jgi:hypothetical protein
MDKELSLTTTLETTPVQSSFSDATSFEHAQRVAKMLSSSDLVPAAYKGNVQNAMIALEMANRMGASPLMVMQNLNIIQGKPSFGSSFIIGAINSCGKFSAELDFEVSGSGETLSCYAFTFNRMGKKVSGPTVTMEMAKLEGWLTKPGSKWKTMPELMIRYRAAAFFGRLYCPEIMMGMQSSEELVDIPHQEIINVEELKALYESKKEILTDTIKTAADRIFDHQETASYSKLKRTLEEA